LGQTKFALQQTAFPGEDGRMPHRDAQQIRDERFTRSSPTFHRARATLHRPHGEKRPSAEKSDWPALLVTLLKEFEA
jgi:hypothetical protein